MAEIMSSNIGSAMTITGNPQNILIGINSGIPYANFLLHLLPISIIGMVILVVVIRLFFKNEFKSKEKIQFQKKEFNYDFISMKFSVPIFLGVIVLFFFSHILQLSIPTIALAGASLVLILGHIKPSKIIKEVDWVLLLFFAGLFIVVHGIEKVGVLNPFIAETTLTNNLAGLSGIHVLSLALSQVVSNVPFTILMLPIMKVISSKMLWLALASGSTLAGNATIVGAMANLIVIEVAKSYGIEIKFWQFMKPGIIVTAVTMLFSVLILYLQLVYSFI